MKNVLIALIFIVSLSIAAKAQQATPQLLKEPAAWTFERFTLPPSFAPNFPYKGAEELRFSPGMFNKDSTDYFTYAFVAQLDNTTTISQNDISNYLLDYFKGLCSSTAKAREIVVDTSKITVAIEKKKASLNNEIIYNALLNVFGVFADGAPVQLNMEVKVLMNITAKKTYLLFIASPHEKNDEVWKELYTIQKDFMMPM
jgi:hypothetical protein